MVNIKIRLVLFFAAKDGVRKRRLGADYSSDRQHLFTKLSLKLKKVGKVTRSFRYDLNQTSYDYTVEVMNRFKELDLVDRVAENLWTEVSNIVQEAVTKRKVV